MISQMESAGPQVFLVRKRNQQARTDVNFANAISRPTSDLISPMESAGPQVFLVRKRNQQGSRATIMFISHMQTTGPLVFSFRRRNQQTRKYFDLANAIGRPSLMLILQTQSAGPKVF